MTPLAALLLPLTAFAAHLLAHYLGFRLARGRIGLLASIFLGFAAGWAVLLISLLSVFHPPSTYGLILAGAEAGGLYSALWYCFFHFVNIGEASLRVRILEELKNRGGSLSHAELQGLYNAQAIVDARLKRLTESGEVELTNGFYRIRKPRLLLAAKGIHFFRVLLHGRQRAAQLASPPGRIVVIGANGFIGRNLSRKLADKKMSLLALSRSQVDLLDPAAGAKLAAILRPKDRVVFLSALTPEHGADGAAVEKNIRMAQALCSSLARTAVRQVVLLSSDAVYASAHSPFTPSTPTRPESPYGSAHVRREDLIQSQCAQRGIVCTTLRPCAVYGPGDTHSSYGPNRFLKSALEEGRIQLFGSGEERRDHLFIDDLTDLIVLGLQKELPGVWNVASGHAITFAQIARAIQSQMPNTVMIEPVEQRQPSVHREHDISRLKSAFPEWQPRSFEEGLAAYVPQAGTRLKSV